MDQRENFIFTHYTQIAETSSRDVRRQQADVLRAIFRGVAHTIRKMIQTPETRSVADHRPS